MTYMALARKWRPKQFSDVVGQSHVVQALSNALNSGRVHHAYLFTGTRGVGKTTLARIFAKSLNCEKGMSAEPCQQCSVCASVDLGNYVDLIEVDAASRTGIDDMRELLDNVQYAPTSGNYKVYLIDEVHMLSKSSFNALLKTLEEPPEHVKFLFATTDPQKLPVTVLSRCLQFNLQALQPNQIAEQIAKILDSENIQYNPVAIDLLSRAADGSMRDSLSLLEQAIAQGSGDVQEDGVRAMLGTVKSKHLDALLTALVASNADALLQTVQEMAMYSIDFQAALDQLLLDLHHISLAHLAEGALTNKVNDVQKYRDYAKQITVEDIQLLYQIGLISKRDLPLAPDHRSGFEMAMMRMLAFKPMSKPIDELVSESTTIDEASKRSAAVPAEAVVDTSVVADKTNIVEKQADTVMAEVPAAEMVAPTMRTESEIQANAKAELPQENHSQFVENQHVINQPSSQKQSFSNQESLVQQKQELAEPLSDEMQTSDRLEPNGNRSAKIEKTSGTPLLGAAVESEPSVERNPPHSFERPAITPQERVEPSFSGASEPSVRPRSASNNHAVAEQPSVTNAHSLRNEPTIEGGATLTNVAPTSSTPTAIPSTPPITPRMVEPNVESDNKGAKREPSFNNQSQPAVPQPRSPQPSGHSIEQARAQNTTANEDADEVEIQVRAASPSSWAGMLERLNLNGLIKELAMNMACDDIGTDPMVFYLSPTWTFLHNQPREDSIVKEIHKVRGDNCGVKVVFEDTVSETPAERLVRLKEGRMQETKTNLNDDKGVQDLMNTFELSMNESSIKPTNEPN